MVQGIYTLNAFRIPDMTPQGKYLEGRFTYDLYLYPSL